MPPATKPSDCGELIRTIHERHEDMSKSYRRIAVYLTQNPSDVAVLSVGAIAERCGVRFAQALGYDGFKALQALFQARLSKAAPGFEARVKALENEIGERCDSTEHSFLRNLVMRDIASPDRCISDSTLSPLAKVASVVFAVPEHEYTFSRSLAAPICLAQALTVALAARLQRNAANPHIPTVTQR